MELLRILSVSLWAGMCCFAAGCSGETKDNSQHIARIETLVQEGDIVFRRGTGITSRAVLVADKGGAYSHTGIVVSVPSGTGGTEWRVVHIVPGEYDAEGVKDRIKAEELSLFFAPDRAVEGAVMRVRGECVKAMEEKCVEAVEKRAEACVSDEIVERCGDGAGASESEAGVAARAARRALRLAATDLAFDHGYDLADTSRMYCTELVYRVFMSEGLDVTAGSRTTISAFGGGIILPTDIQDNPKVEPIYRF